MILRGLKKKYDVYSTSILEALEHYLKPKLRVAVLKTGSELSKVLNFKDANATIDLLHKAANLLFKDFDRKKIIEAATTFASKFRSVWALSDYYRR